jgi:ribosome-binding factor A
VAGYLERLDDDRIGFLTVTGVEVDNDLNRAEVFISTFEQFDDQAAEDEFLDALSEYRKPVQAEIAAQARIRKTPEVVFAFDPAVRTGARIEEILSTLNTEPDTDPATESNTQPDPQPGAHSETEADSGVDQERG